MLLLSVPIKPSFKLYQRRFFFIKIFSKVLGISKISLKYEASFRAGEKFFDISLNIDARVQQINQTWKDFKIKSFLDKDLK